MPLFLLQKKTGAGLFRFYVKNTVSIGIVGCEQFAVGGKSVFGWRRGVSFAGRMILLFLWLMGRYFRIVADNITAYLYWNYSVQTWRLA